MTKLGRTVGADRTVLRPYLGTRPAVIDHVFCLTFVNIVRGQEKAVLSLAPLRFLTISAPQCGTPHHWGAQPTRLIAGSDRPR